jgi:tetratricopeptide (TPR) repeat protein
VQLEKAIDRAWGNFYPTSPEESSLIQYLGLLFFEMKHYPKALIYYKRAYEISRTDPQILLNIALCYQQMG